MQWAAKSAHTIAENQYQTIIMNWAVIRYIMNQAVVHSGKNCFSTIID